VCGSVPRTWALCSRGRARRLWRRSRSSGRWSGRTGASPTPMRSRTPGYAPWRRLPRALALGRNRRTPPCSLHGYKLVMSKQEQLQDMHDALCSLLPHCQCMVDCSSMYQLKLLVPELKAFGHVASRERKVTEQSH
jgi:hypothetical protein